MFISNISEVINKNLSLLFSSVRHLISMKGETKTARIDQKSTFFYFFGFFFLKIQDIRKLKTPIFEWGWHNIFLGQVLTIFQISPNELW